MDRNICFLTVNFPPLPKRAVRVKEVVRIVRAKVVVKEALAKEAKAVKEKERVVATTAKEIWNH